MTPTTKGLIGNENPSHPGQHADQLTELRARVDAQDQRIRQLSETLAGLQAAVDAFRQPPQSIAVAPD